MTKSYIYNGALAKLFPLSGGPALTAEVTPYAPGEVGNLVGSPTSNDMVVSWTEAPDLNNDIDHYVLYFNGSFYANVGLALSATVTGLQPTTQYTVGVQAFDTGGRSGPVKSITVTTLPTGVWPTNSNTGVPSGLSLTNAGQIIVTKPGIISGYNANQIVVRANDVIIENCKLTYSGSAHAIQTDAGYKRTIVRHCTIILPGDSNSGIQARDDSLVEWNNISGGADGVKLWNGSEYRYNYIRMKRPAGSDKHMDGMQGSGKTNYWVHHNDVEAKIADGGNSAIFMQAYTGAVDNPVVDVLVENNRLNGGNYTVFTEDGKTGTGFIDNMIVRNNILGEDHRYGYRHLEGDILWQGNTDLNGQIIS